MENDVKEIRKKVVKLIEKMDNKGVYGAIPYLETCEEMLDLIDEELEAYAAEEE
jgi:hypothetical protein